MRMFERALARTDLPVRFSEGFNPRPKLSLPLPRPVGVATTVDVLAVEFAGPVDPEEVLRQLRPQMPEGVSLRESWTLAGQRPMQPESAGYSLELPAEEARRIGDQVRSIVGAATWPIQRKQDEFNPGKEIDLRAYLLDAALNGNRLDWTVRVTGGGSIRPSEFLNAVGLDPAGWQHRVCRTSIAWQARPADEPESEASTSEDPPGSEA